MAFCKEVTLLDFTYDERQHIRQLARSVADKFANDPELSRYVGDIFQTKADEAFKINMRTIAETLEYTGFSQEAMLRKFKEYFSKITKDTTWNIYKNEDKKDKPIRTISSRDFNQHVVLHILFFIMRGTAVKKAYKKMQKQWVTPLTVIFQAYKTEEPPKGSALQ